MASFLPFPAVRYSPTIDLNRVVAPPYDVLSAADVDRLAARDLYNIVHVDAPLGGEHRYVVAGQILRRWIRRGVMVADTQPSFTICRIVFADGSGKDRQIVGAFGALEVADREAGDVMPHEHTTPRACRDRFDLLRQTQANTSPVSGLSLARGLTDLLRAPAEPVAHVRVGAVTHRLERITDPDRLAAISALVSSDGVLIADGHHRYDVARRYRDCARQRTPFRDAAAARTLAFLSELGQDQFSVEPIHRLYRGACMRDLLLRLSEFFDMKPAGTPDAELPGAMVARGRLALLDVKGCVTWLIPKQGVFDQVRASDGAWVEHVMARCATATVSYQHGLREVRQALADGAADAAILIRPPSLAEIQRTAREGTLLPPWSTSFTPKLLSGLVIRSLVPADEEA